MGVKVEDTQEFSNYRANIHAIGKMVIYRMFKLVLHPNLLWILSGFAWKFKKLIVPVHKFTSKIINQRRDAFYSKKILDENQNEEM